MKNATIGSDGIKKENYENKTKINENNFIITGSYYKIIISMVSFQLSTSIVIFTFLYSISASKILSSKDIFLVVSLRSLLD